MRLLHARSQYHKCIRDCIRRITFLNAVDAPVVLALVQLGRGKPDEALRTLEPSKPYEFGTHAGLLPNYIRALAYLRMKKADEAIAEFSRVLGHRGLEPLNPICPMAQLGVARGYAASGERSKAKAAYEEFFAEWKAADGDIPAFKDAKGEYAKLGQ